MVTRNITKDTATQVNSNLIGVLVHPDTNIKVTVDDIIVDYTYTKFVITNMIPNPVHPGEYALAFTDMKNNVYWSTEEMFIIDTDTYAKYILWPQVDTSDDNGVWLKFPSGAFPEPGSNIFKIDRTDSANPVITEMDNYFETFFLDFSDRYMIPFMKVGEYVVYNPEFGVYPDLSLNYFVDGDFLLHNGRTVGYVVSGPEVVTEPNVTFIKGNVEEGYQTWTNNDDVEFGPRVLYTPTDFPVVGDKALFTLFQIKDEYNPQTIKSIDTTETPVTDPVDCKLSYSVDGSTWTDWSENITEDNNVIANIPRYMYLKFSQDVVITVE